MSRRIFLKKQCVMLVISAFMLGLVYFNIVQTDSIKAYEKIKRHDTQFEIQNVEENKETDKTDQERPEHEFEKINNNPDDEHAVLSPGLYENDEKIQSDTEVIDEVPDDWVPHAINDVRSEESMDPVKKKLEELQTLNKQNPLPLYPSRLRGNNPGTLSPNNLNRYLSILPQSQNGLARRPSLTNWRPQARPAYGYKPGEPRRNPPQWQLRQAPRVDFDNVKPRKVYLLSSMLFVRIFKYDPANMTLAELKQWLHYTYMSGVEHVFLCDAFKSENEQLVNKLQKYVDHGVMTYIPWGFINKEESTIEQSRLECYQYILSWYEFQMKWTMRLDMDEYLYNPGDLNENFMQRFLHNFTIYEKPTSGNISENFTSQIKLDNMVMIGWGNRSKDLLIEKVLRIANVPLNFATKAIFLPDFVKPNKEQDKVKHGRSIFAKGLQMLHYKGRRNQHGGPDTNSSLAYSHPYDIMANNWGPKLRNSLITFSDTDAFDTHSGP